MTIIYKIDFVLLPTNISEGIGQNITLYDIGLNKNPSFAFYKDDLGLGSSQKKHYK